MVVLTLAPVSHVSAVDLRLKTVSGSDCDPTTFEYEEHTVSEGFAVSISADLPFQKFTQIKFGGAVAGLGDTWEEGSVIYTPYVRARKGSAPDKLGYRRI